MTEKFGNLWVRRLCSNSHKISSCLVLRHVIKSSCHVSWGWRSWEMVSWNFAYIWKIQPTGLLSIWEKERNQKVLQKILTWVVTTSWAEDWDQSWSHPIWDAVLNKQVEFLSGWLSIQDCSSRERERLKI